jgi:hypothetical protein
MNQAGGKRLISKQEAIVLLGELELVTCTETIDTVSISNTRVIRKKGGVSCKSKNFVDQYMNRLPEYVLLSMYKYFVHIRNYAKTDKQKHVIPHFLGISGRPAYPVTEDYAKFVMVVHNPWWDKFPTSHNWIADFNNFITSPFAPKEVLMEYNRVMQRHFSGTKFVQPVATDGNHSGNHIPEVVRELIELTGQAAKDIDEYDTQILKNLDRGKEYKWDKKPKVKFKQTMWYALSLFWISHLIMFCHFLSCFRGTK